MSTSTPSDRYRSLTEYQSRWIIYIPTFIGILLMWEIIGRTVGSIFFAPLSEVVPLYIEFVREGQMYSLLIKSLGDMLVGFALASAVAVPTGLVMGRSDNAEKILNPWVSVLFVTSTAAMMPIFIVLFGIDFALRVAIVFLASVLHILLNVYHGAKGVDQTYVRVGRSFGASNTKIWRKITLPATFPFVMAGLRLGMGRAFRGIILIETFILVGYGGFIGRYAQQSISTAPVLALLLNIMILAYLFRNGLEIIQRRLAPWADAEPAM